MKRSVRMMTIAAALGALGAGLGLGGVTPAGATVPAQSTSTEKVAVGDNYFKPDEIQITAGTKVVWTNKGKNLHNVHPVKGSKWGTKSLTKGASYSYKFKKPGTYAYYCTFHGSPSSGQHGVIEVVAATPATTAPTTTPTTAR